MRFISLRPTWAAPAIFSLANMTPTSCICRTAEFSAPLQYRPDPACCDRAQPDQRGRPLRAPFRSCPLGLFAALRQGSPAISADLQRPLRNQGEFQERVQTPPILTSPRLFRSIHFPMLKFSPTPSTNGGAKARAGSRGPICSSAATARAGNDSADVQARVDAPAPAPAGEEPATPAQRSLF
jgi:hypothetical protein